MLVRSDSWFNVLAALEEKKKNQNFVIPDSEIMKQMRIVQKSDGILKFPFNLLSSALKKWNLKKPQIQCILCMQYDQC